ncbi:MAG: tyrosine-type recombinase/integrase [Pseudohongiellaceae bacterium]
MHKLTVADVKAAKLLIAIDGFEGTIVVKTALSLSALLFQRPGEIRHMEWQEINWEPNRWELPGAKMKMGLDHIVPLSAQAKQLLVEIYSHTGRGRYVFPSARGASRPLSENGVRTALRTMGFDKHTMTPHGFRAMARTLLDEQLRCRVELIEHQLAHAVRDATGRAYNRTTHLEMDKPNTKEYEIGFQDGIRCEQELRSAASRLVALQKRQNKRQNQELRNLARKLVGEWLEEYVRLIWDRSPTVTVALMAQNIAHDWSNIIDLLCAEWKREEVEKRRALEDELNKSEPDESISIRDADWSQRLLTKLTGLGASPYSTDSIKKHIRRSKPASLVAGRPRKILPMQS